VKILVATLCIVGLSAIPVANTLAMNTGIEGSGRQLSGDSEQDRADDFFNDLFTRFMDDPRAVSEFDADWIIRQNLRGVLWVMPEKKEAVTRAVAIFDRYKKMPDTVSANEMAFLRTAWCWSMQ